MKGAFRVILPPLLVAIVSIAVTGWGITLGLPSSQRLESIFPNRAELEEKSQELAGFIAKGGGERSEFLERDTLDNFGELARYSPYLDMVRSYNPDEFHTFKVLARMYRDRTILPGSYAYGNFYFYQMAPPLGIGYMLGALNPQQPEYYLLNPDEFAPFYLAGRWWVVLYTAATALLVYFAAARLSGRTAGIFAGLFFALAPITVLAGKTVKVDMPVAFWSTLAICFSINMIERGKWRDYILTGIAIGCAAATKYTGVLVAVIPIVWVITDRFRPWKKLFSAGVAAIVTFLILTPALFLDFNLWWFDLQGLRNGVGRSEPWYLLLGDAVLQYSFDAIVNSGWILAFFFAVPALFAVLWSSIRQTQNYPDAVKTLPYFIILLFIVTAQGQPNSESYLLPALAAWGVIFGVTAVRNKYLAAAGIAVIASLFFWSTAYNQIAAGTDTRLAAAAWINHNIPAGTSIGMRRYPVSYRSVMLNPEKYDLRNELENGRNATLNADYYIDCSFEWDQVPLAQRYFSAHRPPPTENHQLIAEFEAEPELINLIPLSRPGYRINYFFEVVRPRFSVYKLNR